MNGLLYGVSPGSVPFPGLRAFENEESLLFFGREAHTDELLERLGDNRFVAVVGTSGSGKSSLVRAGLRPALDRGYLVDASSRWRFATLRPGSAPIQALATALASTFRSLSLDEITSPLRATSAGISHVVSRGGLAPGESLLIIVDQFEELFRFDLTRDEQADAALFVSQLLAATADRETPIYVVVTMRSEFLGHCAGFSGLVEAFNRSQYLVPALTRDQRQDAVERPLRLFGVTATPALVQRVLNDAGDDPDQLPVLQHVLVRSYRAWERAGSTGPLDLAHYSAVGGIEEALDRHGNEIVAGFTGDERMVTEQLFRSLSVAQGGVAVRRPRRLGQLYDIAAATTADECQRIDRIVGAFTDRNNSFLTLSSPVLQRDTVVDITHESLIRKWKALAVWVRAETRSAEWYADLSRDVTRFHAREAGLWQDPELAAVLSRRAEDGWNESWANQYRRDGGPMFPEVVSFLDESTRQQDERRRAEEELREREQRQAAALARARRRSLIVAALLVVGAVVVSVLTYRLVQAARREAASQQRLVELTDTNRQAESAAAGIREQLDRLAAAPRTGTSDDQQKKNAQEIEQLRQNLANAQAQSKLSQDAIDKLRQDQELTTTDRGGLLKRIETLQQQLTQSNGEREALQTRVDALQKPPIAQPGDDRQALQRQVDEERSKLANLTDFAKALETENADLRKTIGASTASTPSGDYREAFRQGVKAYDLRDWKASVQYMRDAIKFQSSVKDPAKRIPIYGLRLENYAPQSYLGAALFEAKDCAGMLDALKQADAEAPPGAVRSKLQAARVQCAGQK